MRCHIIILIILSSSLFSGECSCPNSFNQVCGEDGYTYPNRCIAECFDIKVEYMGPCIETNESSCPDGSLICFGADYEDDCTYCTINKYSVFSKYTDSNHILLTANAESIYGNIQLDMQTNIDYGRINSFTITLSDLDDEWKQKIEAVKILSEINVPLKDDSYTIDLLNLEKYNNYKNDKILPSERYRK